MDTKQLSNHLYHGFISLAVKQGKLTDDQASLAWSDEGKSLVRKYKSEMQSDMPVGDIDRPFGKSTDKLSEFVDENKNKEEVVRGVCMLICHGGPDYSGMFDSPLRRKHFEQTLIAIPFDHLLFSDDGIYMGVG